MGRAASSGTAGASFAVLIHSPSSSMQREVCHDGSRSTTLDCPIMIMMHRTKRRGRGRVKMKKKIYTKTRVLATICDGKVCTTWRSFVLLYDVWCHAKLIACRVREGQEQHTTRPI